MDSAKKFLRYEISGATYFIWLILFYLTLKGYSFETIINKIHKNDSLPWGGLVIAFPIGNIIHQISVTLKNHVVCRLPQLKFLNDDPSESPSVFILGAMDGRNTKLGMAFDNDKYVDYIKEKISSLNSFYYARVDNGFIAPFLACVTAIIICYHDIEFAINLNAFNILLLAAVIIAVCMGYYVLRINKEIKHYSSLLSGIVLRQPPSVLPNIK